MQDEELTAIILKTLRDSKSPSGVEDIVEIARRQGVDEHYQIHRIGRRLLDQGLVDAVGFTEQSLQASINERGIAALDGETSRRSPIAPRRRSWTRSTM